MTPSTPQTIADILQRVASGITTTDDAETLRRQMVVWLNELLVRPASINHNADEIEATLDVLHDLSFSLP